MYGKSGKMQSRMQIYERRNIMREKQDQIFSRPICDIIRQRTSVRTYISKSIAKEMEEELITFIDNLRGPFSRKVRFKLINSKTISTNSNIKLGTYGVIKGASLFVAAAVEKGDRAMEELGYEFEKFILYATSLGLGTCWLGGTFKKGEFAKAIALAEEELLPIVTPIGYASEKSSFVDSVLKFASGSKNRKSWKELFYNESFNNPLSKECAGDYFMPLEMLRLAPSASNKQPWRIIKDGNKFRFYLSPTKGYGRALGFDIQRIDMGIAMCHFELTAKELGLSGDWIVEELETKSHMNNEEYIVTWKI